MGLLSSFSHLKTFILARLVGSSLLSLSLSSIFLGLGNWYIGLGHTEEAKKEKKDDITREIPLAQEPKTENGN